MANEATTRRLAAVVAADIAGFSRLTARDEEGTIAALRAHRRELIDPTIAAYRGRIANTAGDGILVEFSSVVDALRCAIDVQRGMADRNADVDDDARIDFRIGINLGDVIEEKGDLLGDGVNVAARLEALAEAGGICLSRAARDQVRDRMAIDLQDLGEVEVKNMARPVRVFRVRRQPGTISRPAPWRPRSWFPARAMAIASAVFAIMGAGMSAWLYSGSGDSVDLGASLPARPSIAVLPFANLSDDPQQEYFSDGITNDLITDLSKFRDLFVIASNTVFTYKGNALDVQDVSRQLGVRYVLDGSVQKTDERVRINAQLIDAEDGQHLWAERYDEPIVDLFDLQDRIASQIVRALAVRLSRLEEQRAFATPTSNLEAYDYVLRGQQLLRLSRRADNLEARRMFEHAIDLDPNYAAAHVGLGLTYLEAVLFGWTQAPHSALTRARELALHALTLDQTTDKAHSLLAATHLIRREYDLALVESERAIALNPNDAGNYAAQGATLLWSGHLEGAILALETAYRYDPMMGPRQLTHLGTAYYLKGRYQDAVQLLERSTGLSPDFAYAHTILAATYGQLGDTERAARAAAAVRRLDPFFSVEEFGKLFRNPADASSLAVGLRKTGLM